MRGQEAVGTCRENKPASLHRPLMLDNGISAPQVSKFSRHLPTDPLHDPYFIQSVGLRGLLSFVGFLWPGWKTTAEQVVWQEFGGEAALACRAA